MMITIGVTFCDNDYQYYNRLIRQIKERVKLPYEIIVIDNTEGNKLGDKADFAFGYNAYQFAARYKIIKMAKGNYIWFIDGDDEVIELDYISPRADITIFAYTDANGKADPVEDKVYKKELDTLDFLFCVSKGALWNKIIKKKCFDKIDDYVDNPLLKVVSMEDTFYNYLALKYAKRVETNHRIIYKHNPGLSSSRRITNKGMETLLIGIEDVVKLFDKLGLDVRKSEVVYLAEYIPNAEDPAYILSLLMKIIPDKEYWFERYLQLYIIDERIRQIYIDKFGDVPKNKYTVHYPDGRDVVIEEDYKINRAKKDYKDILNVLRA